MDELFALVGRLYVDLTHAQKYIEGLQKQLQNKDQEIAVLQNTAITKEAD